MNSKTDPMGRAIADYFKTKKASKLRVFSPMFEEDEIPLTTLFRSYKSMPEIERKALDLANSYVFEDENGIIEYPDTDGYYGEVSYQMQYKDTIGELFQWLYIDANTLKRVAEKNGYSVEVVAEGEHYDYLVKIAKNA